MKLKFLSLITLLFLCSASIAATQVPEKPVLGKDWLLMSHAEKVTYISSAIDRLQRHGVPFGKSPDQYLEAMNQLSDSPKMLSADATNMLTSYVYETEPASRQAFEKLLKK